LDRGKALKRAITRCLGTLFLLIGIPSRSLFAETLVYREYSGKHREIHTYIITRVQAGIQVRLLRTSGDREIVDECELDADWNTVRWIHRDPATGTDLRGMRQGNRISLDGHREGKKIIRVFSIDAAPWKQLFSIDFAPFARLVGGVFFWSIGTSGPGAMKAARFRAVPAGNEPLSVNSVLIPTRRIRISLDGWRSIAWHGDYWFRLRDNRYFRFSGKSIFGRPTIKELIEESPDPGL